MKVFFMMIVIHLSICLNLYADGYISRKDVCEYKNHPEGTPALYVKKILSMSQTKSIRFPLFLKIETDGERTLLIDNETLNLLRNRKLYCSDNFILSDYWPVKVFDKIESRNVYFMRKSSDERKHIRRRKWWQ